MLKAWVRRHPQLLSVARRVVRWLPGRQASGAYASLDGTSRDALAQELRGAWKEDAIPARQRELVERDLAAFRAGDPVPAFDALIQALMPVAQAGTGQSLLEIGCSSGFYSEVLRIKGLSFAYTGCDYSAPFVAMARGYYPDCHFDVEDATALRYADGAFDVVVSGCCLLHIPEYALAVSETARVARHTAVFHRTPVYHRLATRHFSKMAYGVKTVEIHFNEQELVALFRASGLRVTGILTLATDWRDGDAFAVKTYVCEKVAT